MPTEKKQLEKGSLRTVLATVLLLVLLMTTTGNALALDVGAAIGGTNIATTLEVPGSYLSPQLSKLSSSTSNTIAPRISTLPILSPSAMFPQTAPYNTTWASSAMKPSAKPIPWFAMKAIPASCAAGFPTTVQWWTSFLGTL